ncbi:MAG: cytochrome C [Rhodospirillaceae bacterium]|nr:cytochrome C [Rhodospirillaceae bacterium]
MNPRVTAAMLLAAGAALCAPGAARAQDANPMLLALSCAGCHGPEGRSPGSIPPLWGRTAANVLESLAGFKSGQRASTVMGRIAKGYTDTELEAVARYWAQPAR